MRGKLPAADVGPDQLDRPPRPDAELIDLSGMTIVRLAHQPGVPRRDLLGLRT